jgi:hypothetical protein
MTELCEIMKRHGSDKGLGWHNYTTIYHELFSGKRHDSINLFELGLGTNNISIPSNMGVDGKPGASLRGWAEYFQNGQIYGADIDRSILFSGGRIKTYYCDQTDSVAIEDLCDQLDGVEFDIIIDDGLHEFEANMTFMANFIHKLKPNGVYVVEDLTSRSVNLFRQNLKVLSQVYPNIRFELTRIPHEYNNVDNNLLIAFAR